VTSSKLRYCCDECRIVSPGVHWIEPEDPTQQPYPVPCPEKVQAQQAVKVAELTAKQKDAARKEARRIVADTAERLPYFSANDCHDESDAAQIVSQGAMGEAFTWARRKGLIEHTDQRVMSNRGTTRRTIDVWRSLHERFTNYGRAS
jgi:hypothetical protein